MAGVYMVECLATNELYVGSTHMSFDERFRLHRSSLACGGGPPLLQDRYNQYGIEAFRFTGLKEFPPEQLARREAQAMEILRPTLCTNIPRPELSGDLKRYRLKHGIALDAPRYAPRALGEVDGVRYSVADIAKKFNLTEQLVRGRIAAGKSGWHLIKPRYAH